MAMPGSEEFVAVFCPNCDITLNEDLLDDDHGDGPTVPYASSEPFTLADRIPNGATCYHCGHRVTRWSHIRNCSGAHAARESKTAYIEVRQRERQAQELQDMVTALASGGAVPEADPVLTLVEIAELTSSLRAAVERLNRYYAGESEMADITTIVRKIEDAVRWGMR